MERQQERLREKEPALVFDRIAEETHQKIDDERKLLASLPRVLKFDKTPWTQGVHAYHKPFCRGLKVDDRLKGGPIYTFSVYEQILPPLGRNGKHRHYAEAIFYIVEGNGYEVHDGVKYPWQTGDIVCVPSYCIHQHFNADPERGARLFYCVPRLFDLLGVSSIEQMEMHKDYKPPEGSVLLKDEQGNVVGYRLPNGYEFRLEVDEKLRSLMVARQEGGLRIQKAETYYDDYLKLLEEETHWRRTVDHVVKGAAMPWQETRMGRMKYLVHPRLPAGLRLFDAFIQELPPGGRSGKHRHVAEEVHLILEGQGYDVLDGVKWEWEKEDIVCIPVNTVHQHFNADPERPARFLAYQPRLYNYIGHGGIEHLEDAGA